MLRSLTPTCYLHRCAFVAPRLIGTDQKCARGGVKQERDSEMFDTEAAAAAAAATGVSGQALTDRRKGAIRGWMDIV